MSCGVGHRHSLDPALPWLWQRPAATAPIRPLAWEPPYAVGVALENTKKKKTKTHKNKKQTKNPSKPKLVVLFHLALAAGKLSRLIPEKSSGLYGMNFGYKC